MLTDDYLSRLERDLTSLLASTVKSYESIESKAKYVATAFTTLLASVMAYVLQSFDQIDFWQKGF